MPTVSGVGAIVAPSKNVALASNGASAVASSEFSASYPASSVINGDRKGTNWNSGGGWNDANQNTWPDTIDITFASTKTIKEIIVITLQDAAGAGVEPDANLTFSLYGITAFKLQYNSSGSWIDISGTSVTGNNKVMRSFKLSTPITTDKIRLYITASVDGFSRVIEIEAYEDSGAIVTRTAKPTNIGSAQAFGALKITSLKIVPSAIASAEKLALGGTFSISKKNYVTLVAIQSYALLGTGYTIKSLKSILPSAITTLFNSGSAKVIRTASPLFIASVEAIGIPSLSFRVILNIQGIESLESVGAGRIGRFVRSVGAIATEFLAGNPSIYNPPREFMVLFTGQASILYAVNNETSLKSVIDAGEASIHVVYVDETDLVMGFNNV